MKSFRHVVYAPLLYPRQDMLIYRISVLFLTALLVIVVLQSLCKYLK